MADASLADRSIELVRTWVGSAHSQVPDTDAAQRRLTDLLRDPAALDFTVSFIDRVVRPEDPKTATRHLRALSAQAPRLLSPGERRLLVSGAALSRFVPRVVQRRAHRKLRRLVDHLVLDATPQRLTSSIRTLTSDGDRLNLSLLGEAVLGEAEATRHRDRIIDLVRRTDVDYVSVKVSSVASQLTVWAFDAAVERVVERLQPIYAAAVENHTFVNLDMEDHATFDLTVAVFMRALDQFPELEAGIALQAYLPDSLDALQKIQEWAAGRRAAGGAPVTVRVVKGANLGMEHVESTLCGWPLATWPTKADTDAHVKRLLDWALTPERTRNVRIGVAGQNLFDLAYAKLLADDRAVEGVHFEALLGFDGGPLRATRKDLGPLRLYAPVVAPGDVDAALAYLVRRLQETAAPGNFLTAMPHLGDADVFDREADRFREAVVASRAEATVPPDPPAAGFRNAADTNPSTAEGRQRAALAASRSTYTTLGSDEAQLSRLLGPTTLETLIASVRDGAEDWRTRAAQVRAWTLHQVGATLAARRGDLVAVMMAETAKTFAEADAEVSEAIDFAHYYADAAVRLDATDGASFDPVRLTVVTPPWNFPVAIPAGSVLAALAAGSAVILKPAPQSPRSAAVLVEALWDAGVPRDVVALAVLEDGPLSQALVSHPSVDRVVLTGSWDTAELFRSWRADLPLMAETSGKNAIVVTPSADIDRAVTDLVRSAFGNAGQKCSAASLAILVGSLARSERFRRQLVDATTSLAVGMPDDLRSTVGPLISPAGEPLRTALTGLDTGESWLVEPRQLDADGRLWTPGIKLGVRPGSGSHTTEYFGPVLGVMTAPTLRDAIAWQNATGYGLTAGLHSLDADEINAWLGAVEAGNLYVNRHITGAIVQRQPFGGWKRSAVGVTAKTGGPNYVAQFGTWRPARLRRTPADVGLARRVRDLLDTFGGVLDDAASAYLRGAAASDQLAWAREFGVAKDVSGLGCERNVLRYRPADVSIRSEGTLTETARVLLAATRAGARVAVSSAVPLPTGVAHVVESSEAWLARVAADRPARVRLVGAPPGPTAQAVDGDPDVAIHGGAVTASGRVELLPFLREQSISITNHRYGLPDHSIDRVLPRK